MDERCHEILNAVCAAEREAAELILHAHGVMSEMKTGRRDVVTEYDRRVQALLVERLSAAVPGARFFCEENSVQQELGAPELFIIDPIDGTMNFVKGLHHSCISVAYARSGVLTAAAVYNPYADELFTAVKGAGAYLNSRPIHVDDLPLSESLFCFGSSPYNPEMADETFRLARLAFGASLDLRRLASAELDLCMVAAGRAGLYFEPSLSLWDYAAGSLILREAGGVCSQLDGSPLPFDGSKPSIAAGCPRAHADFMALIGRK